MIQTRCLNCNKVLFEEELIEGSIEKICDKCKMTNRIERQGRNEDIEQTII